MMLPDCMQGPSEPCAGYTAQSARIAALETELAERTRDLDYANERAASHLDDAYKLRNELAAERERREAAEWVLKEIRIRLHAAGRRPEECWEMSEIDGHFAHFAHYKD